MSKSHCVLNPVYSRLIDTIKSIQHAEKNYFRPASFRRHLNNAIQNARSVTFVLQSQKKSIPGFDDWYPAWQNKMHENEKLRWIVEARNYIVKQGELDINSTVHVTLVDSYFNNDIRTLSIAASIKPSLVASSFFEKYNLNAHEAENCFLRVERIWSIPAMPTHEILSLLAYACNYYFEILDDLHTLTREKCMHQLERKMIAKIGSFDKRRVVNLRLSSGETYSFEVSERKGVEATLALQRYGLGNDKLAITNLFDTVPETDKKEEEDFLRLAFYLMNMARHMIRFDKEIVPFVFYLKGSGIFKMSHFECEDQSEKYLMWREIARQVKLYNVDGICFITEAWRRRPEEKYIYAKKTIGCHEEEVLLLVLETKEGLNLCLQSLIVRDGENVYTEDIVKGDDFNQINFLEPVRYVWGN